MAYTNKKRGQVSFHEKKPDSTTRRPARDSSYLSITLSFLSLLAPIGYMVGYYYDQAYLETYGIDTKLFPRSAQEYIVETGIALLELVDDIGRYTNNTAIVIKWLGVLLFVAAYIVALKFLAKLMGSFFAWLAAKYSWFAQLVEKLKDKTTANWIVSGLLLLLAPAMLIYVPLCLALPAYFSYLLGQGAANKEITQFRGCEDTAKTRFERCTSISENGHQIGQGRLIASSEKYVALFDGEKTVVIPIRPETALERRIRTKKSQ